MCDTTDDTEEYLDYDDWYEEITCPLCDTLNENDYDASVNKYYCYNCKQYFDYEVN